VMDEVQSREVLLKDSYPFTCDGYRVELKHPDAATTTYLFCLGLSLLPPAEIENEQRAIQFETVVLNAARKFFGGDALRIGAPWRSADVPDYGTLLDKVIELIPNLGQKSKTAAPGGGDAGWDVLIVRNFSDNLYPRLIALGNCATGRHDWKRKGMEVQPTLFWTYFLHAHLSVFITFFAVPFMMDEDARKRKLSSSNLTLDRLRICEYEPTVMADAATWLATQRENALNLAIA